jgi:hypothetical protein
MAWAIGGNSAVQGDFGIATCDCCNPCDYPLLDVTMTWTDLDITKDYLGSTFTNGETIAICPTNYNCAHVVSSTITSGSSKQYRNSSREFWQFGGGVMSKKRDVYSRYQPPTTGAPSFTTSFTDAIISGVSLKNYIYDYRKLFTSFSTGYTKNYRWKNLRVARGAGDDIATDHGFKDFERVSTGTFLPPWSSTVKHTVITPDGTNTPTFSNFASGITNAFEGTITSASGLTITWAKNNTGVPWGDCF